MACYRRVIEQYITTETLWRPQKRNELMWIYSYNNLISIHHPNRPAPSHSAIFIRHLIKSWRRSIVCFLPHRHHITADFNFSHIIRLIEFSSGILLVSTVTARRLDYYDRPRGKEPGGVVYNRGVTLIFHGSALENKWRLNCSRGLVLISTLHRKTISPALQSPGKP